MKRTIYIESIKHDIEDTDRVRYASVSQNAQWFMNTMDHYSVCCEDISQFSDSYWCITIKGKRKNVKAFISRLLVEASFIYNIRTY